MYLDSSEGSGCLAYIIMLSHLVSGAFKCGMYLLCHQLLHTEWINYRVMQQHLCTFVSLSINSVAKCVCVCRYSLCAFLLVRSGVDRYEESIPINETRLST